MNNFCKRIAKMLSAFSCKQADIHCIDKTMIDLSWLGKLEFKKYVAPFAIDRHNQYLPALKEKLHSLVNDFRLCSADPEFVKIAECYAESLIQSVELYYKGCVIEAQNIVNHLVNEFEEGGVAISNINNSIAFPPSGENDRYSEVQFTVLGLTMWLLIILLMKCSIFLSAVVKLSRVSVSVFLVFLVSI